MAAELTSNVTRFGPAASFGGVDHRFPAPYSGRAGRVSARNREDISS